MTRSLPSSPGVGRGPERRDRPAFTLIELLAVLAILGVLSISAAPALQSITSSKRGAVSREIDRRLSLARATAMATGAPSFVVAVSSPATGRPLRLSVTVAMFEGNCPLSA